MVGHVGDGFTFPHKGGQFKTFCIMQGSVYFSEHFGDQQKSGSGLSTSGRFGSLLVTTEEQ
jgi:hypothetical protein